MAKAIKVEELVVETENKAGMLAAVSQAVSSAGANIRAICAYAMDDKARFLLVTDNNKKAAEALKNKGFKVSDTDAVLVKLEDKVGTLGEAAAKLKAKGINLEYIYGTTCDCECECDCECTLVFRAKNNDEAIKVL